jgi:hypothetical protein
MISLFAWDDVLPEFAFTGSGLDVIPPRASGCHDKHAYSAARAVETGAGCFDARGAFEG